MDMKPFYLWRRNARISAPERESYTILVSILLPDMLTSWYLVNYSQNSVSSPYERKGEMMTRWQNITYLLGVLTLTGCSGKIVNWLEEPTSFDEKVQQMREDYTKSEPIVGSSAEQRLKWRTEWSKKFHKMLQLHNSEYQDYRHLCLVGETLPLYLKHEKQIRYEKVNRPNKRRSK